MAGIKPFSSSKPVQKRQPFSGRSLPQPGESLQDEAFKHLARPFVFAITGFMAVTFGLADVILRWAGIEPSPWPQVVLGALLLGVGGDQPPAPRRRTC